MPTVYDNWTVFPKRAPSTYNACTSGLIAIESGPNPFAGDPTLTDGMFGTNITVRSKNIRDGLSSTIMFGECIFEPEMTGPDLVGQPEVVDHWYVVSNEMNPDPSDDSGDVSEGFSSTAIQINVHDDPNVLIDNKELGFGSRHPQGTQVVFADGHVQFISEGIDLPTWSALGTKFGQEAVAIPE